MPYKHKQGVGRTLQRCCNSQFACLDTKCRQLWAGIQRLGNMSCVCAAFWAAFWGCFLGHQVATAANTERQAGIVPLNDHIMECHNFLQPIIAATLLTRHKNCLAEGNFQTACWLTIWPFGSSLHLLQRSHCTHT